MVQNQIGKDKVKLLHAIFDGAKTSKGEPIYSGWFYDAGINQAGWRAWKLGDSQTAQPNARNITLRSQLAQLFYDPLSTAAQHV